MKKDCYYFTHDSNAKDDPKCVLMIEQLGMEGYGIYWMLVETLRDQPDYTYPVANIPALARRYNTSAEKVRTVVYNYALFTVKDDRIFFSESLNRRMKLFNDKRLKRSEAGRLGMARRWCDNNVITPLLQKDNTDITIKVKESKVKESIERVKGDCKGEESSPESPDAIEPTSADKPRRGTTKRTAFVAPSPETIKDYFLTIGGTDTDAKSFYDYYTANGWRTGRNAIKDWRAAARNWMNRKPEFNKPAKTTDHETTRKYNFL